MVLTIRKRIMKMSICAKVIVAVVGYTLLSVAYSIVVGRTFTDGGGAFGDSFGAFNAYFTGLAFIGVIITVFLQTKQVAMQSKELKLQRQELRDTREELRRTADAQEKTEKALALQVKANALAARIHSCLALQNNIFQTIRSNGFMHLGDPEAKSIQELNEMLKFYYNSQYKDSAVCLINRLIELKEELSRIHFDLMKLSEEDNDG